MDPAPLAALRHRTFARHPCYRADAGALAAHVEFLRGGLGAIAAGGGSAEVCVRDGAPIAYVLWWRVAEAWFGAPALRVVVDHAPGAEAVAWTCAALDRIPRDPDFELMLNAAYPEVRAHLLARGFGIDSVTLAARPAVALQRLMAAKAPPRTRPDLGVEIQPLTPAHADAVVALQAAVFGARPEFCWFGARPKYLVALGARLREALPGPREVALRDGRVLGYWGGEYAEGNALWGRAGGMELLLAPELQGQGLVKTAYRRLLEAQVAAGVEVFKGGTCQPAVLGLARLMGRRPVDLWVRATRWFEPAHFEETLRAPDGR